MEYHYIFKVRLDTNCVEMLLKVDYINKINSIILRSNELNTWSEGWIHWLQLSVEVEISSW